MRLSNLGGQVPAAPARMAVTCQARERMLRCYLRNEDGGMPSSTSQDRAQVRSTACTGGPANRAGDMGE